MSNFEAAGERLAQPNELYYDQTLDPSFPKHSVGDRIGILAANAFFYGVRLPRLWLRAHLGEDKLYDSEQLRQLIETSSGDPEPSNRVSNRCADQRATQSMGDHRIVARGLYDQAD